MAIEIKGLDSLIKKLDALGGNSMSALVGAVNRTTLAAQVSAQRLCPVDTGNLKENIMTRFEPGGDKYTGVVFNDVEYALYVEMGTETKPGVPKMPARPFMYGALKENEDTFHAEAERALLNAIRRTAGGV